jgi:hypothetical protein
MCQGFLSIFFTNSEEIYKVRCKVAYICVADVTDYVDFFRYCHADYNDLYTDRTDEFVKLRNINPELS